MRVPQRSDFGQGKVYAHIVRLAIPQFIAQLVQMLYSVVDRVYIGHLPDASSFALTGLGLTFPLITILTAFTNLFGMGGSPLFSIARGEGNTEKAGKILGNTATLLFGSSFLLLILSYVFMEPLLYVFGASGDTFPYAREYLNIYLLGTPFVMLGTGLNGFIHAQGFAKIGMLSVVIGALVNAILDPIFIFVLDMGIRGAAVATVISQIISAVWVLCFLCGKKVKIPLQREYLCPAWRLVRRILGLGTAGFVMSASGGLVQIAANATLRRTGGDLYVGVMTVISSVRDMFFLPAIAVTNAAQPVIGYNFGAGKKGRVRSAVRFMTYISVLYMLFTWLVVFLLPGQLIMLFTSDSLLKAAGVPALRAYFFGSFMMSMQMAGQSAFVGLGLSRKAVFFSLFRKVIIVIPLTLILPYIAGFGQMGVFYAEAVSNFIGGTACYATMRYTLKGLLAEKNTES